MCRILKERECERVSVCVKNNSNPSSNAVYIVQSSCQLHQTIYIIIMYIYSITMTVDIELHIIYRGYVVCVGSLLLYTLCVLDLHGNSEKLR